jgi:hypothetical protein
MQCHTFEIYNRSIVLKPVSKADHCSSRVIHSAELEAAGSIRGAFIAKYDIPDDGGRRG